MVEMQTGGHRLLLTVGTDWEQTAVTNLSDLHCGAKVQKGVKIFRKIRAAPGFGGRVTVFLLR